MVDDLEVPGGDPSCRVFVRPAAPLDEAEALQLGFEMFDALMRARGEDVVRSTDSDAQDTGPAPR